MEKGWIWKTYFYFVVILSLGSAGLLLAYNDSSDIELDWVDIVGMPVGLFQLIALFGFVYYRKIISPLAWKILFFVSVAYEFWWIWDTLTDPELSGTIVTVIVVAMSIIWLPWLYGIFQYGFRSKELWRNAV